MRYFLIAGEASGDLHASALIQSIRSLDPEAQFALLGGDMMAEAANVQPVIHYREMAYMGFVEVVKHLGAINRNFKAARKAIIEFRPDCLILIDYPSFNLKMAKFAKRQGLKVYYYIPPKIWAWKEWRVKSIKRYVDRVFAIFPFEVDFYRRHDYQAVYVGNPSVEEIDSIKLTLPSRDEFIAANKLADKPLVALLPGSRLSEIRENLPLMDMAMRQFPQYRGIVAGAPGVNPEFYAQFTHRPVVHGQTYALLANARAALVTSGTATLEAALIGTPQVAMYQGGGSKMLYNIMKRLLKIRHVTLPNLIAGRTVIPELLMHLCTADAAAQQLGIILPDRQGREDMLNGYREMRGRLGTDNAPLNAARLIIEDLTNTTNGDKSREG